ncbi:MAG: fluoride efflux transporter CrcB [Caulobacteraceae bacterium]
MKKYLLIGTGGFIGAIIRFYLKGIHIYHYNETMPLNTLLINIAGCFILGLFLTVALEVWEINTDVRLGIATGLLGAFTTFSTMCKETYLLISQGDYYSAISYLTISTMLGIAAVYFGVVIAREVISKYVDKTEADDSFDEYAVSSLDEEVS